MIGHTTCAAGLAGLIKMAKAVYHKLLPSTLGVEPPNSKARFAEGPFYVNSVAQPWLQYGDAPQRPGSAPSASAGPTSTR